MLVQLWLHRHVELSLVDVLAVYGVAELPFSGINKQHMIGVGYGEDPCHWLIESEYPQQLA